MTVSPYSSAADWYDFFYEHSGIRDYDQETASIADAIRFIHPRAKKVLDVACATGEHALRLSEHYEVDGIDIESDFVTRARIKNPDGYFTCEDMVNFDLNNLYDIVLCLSGSIAYVKTIDKVQETLVNFSRHLADGGYILLEPWFILAEEDTESKKQGGKTVMITAETPEIKVCRMVHSQRHGKLSILEFVYLIGSQDGVQLKRERHELGLFTDKEIRNAFSNAGLVVRYDPDGLCGRGSYVGQHRGKMIDEG